MALFDAQYPKVARELREAEIELKRVPKVPPSGWCNHGAPDWTSSDNDSVACQGCVRHAAKDALEKMAKPYPNEDLQVYHIVVSGQAREFLMRHLCPLNRPDDLEDWDRVVAGALSCHPRAPFDSMVLRFLWRKALWRPEFEDDKFIFWKKLAEKLAIEQRTASV